MRTTTFQGLGKGRRSFPITHVVDMATSSSSSQIFCPYRAIGFFSNHVPLVCQSQGPDSVIVTSVGKSFHVYKVSQIISEFHVIMLLV